jgi:hypothetical protein
MLRRLILAVLLVLAGPVLAQSPPSGSQVYVPDNATSATVAALNAEVGPLQLSGEVGAALVIPASSTLVATMTPYCSGDNATWTSTSFYPDATGNTTPTLTTASGTAYQYGIVLLSACKYVKVRATSYTSGTVSATLTANQVAVIGNTVQVTATDTVQSGCVLNAANATCQVSMVGKSSAGFVVTAVSSPTGITLVQESSRDGPSWDGHPFADVSASGDCISSIPNASLAVGYGKSLVLGNGEGFVRVRASAWTSGSVTVTVRASDSAGPTVCRTVDQATVTTGLVTTTTLSQIVAAPAAGAIRLLSVVASASVAATTTADQQLRFKSGTGSNCATGTADVIGAFNAANGGFAIAWPPGAGPKLAATSALCWIHAAAGSKIITVTYEIVQ